MASSTEQTFNRRRVLVVDDNVDAADSLATVLELRGHEVYCVYDGVQAVEKTLERAPEVILLDIGMPHVDGLETARRIRQLSLARQPLIVATTAWSSPRDRMAAEAAGFDVHLVKPVELDVLYRLLQVDADNDESMDDG
jgi:CheY-like chemotaxis protein